MRNTAACGAIYTAVLKDEEAVFQRPNKDPSGNHWAVESEIFWQLRVETISSLPRPPSRVFSKNLLRQLPDGTTQVQNSERNAQ
jgi:hypothetical protein